MEDISTQRIESNETGEGILCENCKCKRVREVDQKKDESESTNTMKHTNKGLEPKSTYESA